MAPNYFSSTPLRFLLIALGGGLMLASTGTGCGPSRACFLWTEAEGTCPAQTEALPFFQDSFCSNTITSVDSDGSFEDGACCYEVTETEDDFGAPCAGEPPFPPGTESAVSVGSGIGGVGGVSTGGSAGSAGMGAAGGAGGAGGNMNCAGCQQFLTETNPPELCADSVPLYEAFTSCKCFGACSTACKDACTSGTTPTDTCENCLLDSTNGCGKEMLVCVQDT